MTTSFGMSIIQLREGKAASIQQNGWHNAMGWQDLGAIFGGAHLLISKE